MTTGRVGLRDGRAGIARVETECPWPGLGPIDDVARVHQLRGRDDDTVDIVYEIRDHRLTVLLGESGVGKTSVLNVKVIPRLEAEGFRVLVCRDWGSADAGDPATDFATFLATKVGLDAPPGTDAFAELDGQHGRRLVVVLDQFEELIRHQPTLAAAAEHWVIEATDRFDFRVLISLRSEFEHRLRGLKIGPYQRVDLHLEPIEERFVSEIVEDNGDPARWDASLVGDDAARRIIGLWNAAKGNQPWSGVGLSHLQALLYVLWHVCRQRGGDRIELDDIKAFEEAAATSVGRAGSDHAAFEYAVRRTVEVRLDNASAAFGVARDPALTHGARGHVVRMSRHLSSSGYKVDQDRWHLAELVLEDELATLAVSDHVARAIFDHMAQIVDTERGASVAERGGAQALHAGLDWVLAERDHLMPSGGDRSGLTDLWDADPDDVTAGPMMGLNPQLALVEEFRRFFLALEWLTGAGLVRETATAAGATRVALIHDAVGRGLEDWADQHAGDAEFALGAITAVVGAHLSWPNPVRGSADRPLSLVNLRWRASRVNGVDFRYVVFLNCDFRESVFVDCTFEGATFVNCLLDGATFRRCIIRGAVGDLLHGEKPRPKVEQFQLPSFYWEAPDEAAVLNRYRETEVPADGIRSRGGPAEPALRDPAADLAVDVHGGGFFMYGGRLSSLMFASCTFDENSAVGLYHSAGTSLEFAEQGQGFVYLRDVALRGFGVSPSRDAPAASDARPPGGAEPAVGDGGFRVRYYDCTVQNVWISSGMRGRAEFEESVAWQVFNSNPCAEFEFEFASGKFYGLVNTGKPAKRWRESRLSATSLGKAASDVRLSAAKIDYRSTPAKVDEELRRDRAAARRL